MTETPLHYLPLHEQARMIRERRVSAVDLVTACLDRIDALNPRLSSYITVAREQALDEAKRIDADLAADRPVGPLAGVPIGVKDSIPTRGILTTENSRLCADWVPDRDAVPVERLRAAGAIVIGKTNLNEFGWSRPSEADLAPPPWNPWNPERMSVGSSSGSGAAAAAGMCSAALGTDGGGSIRLPAGAHNLVAIKPTHGMVTRAGMDRNSHSEISPIARTAADAAMLLDHMAESPGGYFDAIDADVSGWRVGVPRRFIDSAPNEPEITEAFTQFVAALEALGCEIVDIDLRGMAEARIANFLVLNAEAYQRHARSLEESWDLYGPITRVYLLQGAFLSAEDLLNAQQVGDAVRDQLESEVFAQEGGVRFIATPTAPFASAERSRRPGEHSRGINACFTSPFNITGHPSISVPGGFGDAGLPVGMMLTAALGDDLGLLQLAHSYEQSANWHTMHPAI